MDHFAPAELTAEALLTRIRAGQNVSAAKQYLEDYGYSRIWSLMLKFVNCDPEKKDLMVEYKCEMRSILLLMQELKIDLADAETASKRLKEMNSGGRR